jgi:hypothetical protein
MPVRVPRNVELDIWVVHPGVNTGTGADRVTLAQLGLPFPTEASFAAWRALALVAVRSWWPAIPAADLRDATVEFTDRSTPDKPEVIVYFGVDRATARGKLSPNRARA